ncbi:hypothetical protein KKE60_04555 [Patescibacteria group bacterium]|nr:hypothetical protein [Patescibacteria group bacterium]
MARKGHKEGCQCAVCKRMAVQIVPEIEKTSTAGRTAGSLNPGEQFAYKGQNYTRYGETEEAVVAEAADGEVIQIPKDTVV